MTPFRPKMSVFGSAYFCNEGMCQWGIQLPSCLNEGFLSFYFILNQGVTPRGEQVFVVQFPLAIMRQQTLLSENENIFRAGFFT